MNVTIRTTDLPLTDALRAAVRALAEEALRAMGAPPDTEVLVALRGPSHPGSDHHRAKAVVHAPGGILRAAGSGPGADAAVADLKQALLHQATSWRAWHEGGRPTTADGAWMHGRRISERAMREVSRLGDPNASSRGKRRPRSPR